MTEIGSGWEVRFTLDVPISERSIKEIDGIKFETEVHSLGIELKGFKIIIPATNEADARILAEGKANRIFDYLSWIHNRSISGYFSGMTEIRPAGDVKRGIASFSVSAIIHNPVDLDFSLILDVLEGRDEKLLRQLGHYSLGLKAADIISKYREFYQVIEDEQDVGGTPETKPLESIEDIDVETIKRVIRNLLSHPVLSKNKTHVSIATTLLGRPYLDMSNVNDKYVFSWPASRLAFGDYSILSVPKLPVSS
ncbi:MAG TPA: hypothetical protein VMY43_00730 [Methanothrix sp.]|nr:hypothetical protein [Methanothrix sp.]